MLTIEELENELDKIKERNKKVEADKAWETSLSRKIIVAILTYVVVVIFFFFAALPNPLTNSIVPTLGFIISTLSIPVFRKIWLKFKNK